MSLSCALDIITSISCLLRSPPPPWILAPCVLYHSSFPSFFPSDSIDEDGDPASEFGDTTIFYDWKECSTILDQSIVNDSIIVPESLLKLSDGELKKELEKYGEIPGPIMPSTKNVYIKRLARLQSGSANSKVNKILLWLVHVWPRGERIVCVRVCHY